MKKEISFGRGDKAQRKREKQKRNMNERKMNIDNSMKYWVTEKEGAKEDRRK
jgi:hypothetical protein